MNRIYIRVLIFFFALMSTQLSWSQTQVDENYLNEVKKTWTYLGEKEGIQLFKKVIPDSSVTSFRGIGVLNIPMPILFHIIRDVPNSVLWTPNLISKKLVRDISVMEGVALSVNFLPWPATNRETLLLSKLFFDEKNNYFVLSTKSVDLPDYPPAKDLVRGVVYESSFVFKPVPEGTMVDLSALIDPKGLVPSWLTNFIQKKWPHSFLKSLENYAKSKSFTPEPEFIKMFKDYEEREHLKLFPPTPTPVPLPSPTSIPAPTPKSGSKSEKNKKAKVK